MKITNIHLPGVGWAEVAFLLTLLLSLISAPAAAQLYLPANNTVTVAGNSTLRVPNGTAIDGTLDLTGANATLKTADLVLNSGTINLSGTNAELDGNDVTVSDNGRLTMMGANTELLANNLTVDDQGQLSTSGGGARLEIQNLLNVGENGLLRMQSTTNLVQADEIDIFDSGTMIVEDGELFVLSFFNMEDGGIFATRSYMELVDVNWEGDVVFGIAGDRNAGRHGRAFVEGDITVNAFVTTRLEDGYTPTSNQRYRLVEIDDQWVSAPANSGFTAPGPEWEYDLEQNFLDISFDATSLPVEWLSFTGRWTGKANELDWQTASETGSSHFEVERQTPSGEWAEIGRVAASGDREAVSTYAFTDHTPGPANVSYYRLRQVDLDGRYDYSAVVAIGRPEGEGGVQVFPNPATDRLTIATQTPTDFAVVNMMGQVLLRGRTNGGDLYRLALPTGMANGTYLLRMGDGRTARFTVAR